jgi:hypothetical protein
LAAASRAAGPALDVYDRSGQWNRAMGFVREFAAARVDKFDANGKWIGKDSAPWRGLEQSAYVAPFFELGTSEAVAKANAIVENQNCHTLDLAHALVFYRDKMTAAAIARAEKLIKRDVDETYQEFRWTHFQGDNDNFQFHAAATVAMWGVYTKDRKYIEDATRRLEDFKAIMLRRGFASEFNSPSYLPLHLHPLAQIVEAVDDPTLKKLAYDIETRTWLDLLCHYHAPSGTQCGPWAREYLFDVLGSTFSRLNLYLLLGDKLPGDWKEGYKSECVEHGLVRGANRSCVRYHCPTWLADWAINRKYPFESIGTAEGAASFMTLVPDRSGSLWHWNWKDSAKKDDNLYTTPSWHTRIVQYQPADYAMGTTTRPFNEGFADYRFVVTMPARKPLTTTRDIVRVMSRYILDEQQPGAEWQGKRPAYCEEPIGFNEAGRSICLQHERTAMVLYRPHVILEYKPTSLKTAAYWPKTNFGKGEPRADEIYIGLRELDGFTGEANEPTPVFVRIADTYMAFIPLINNEAVGVELARKAAVRVEPMGKMLGVAFYNYQGEPIELNQRQYCMMGNGFVCEMGSKAEDGRFDAFRARFAPGKYEITDFYRRTVHSRGAYTRCVKYRREGLTLETEYNPTTEGIRYQSINGRVPKEPQLDATDLPRENVPFLECGNGHQ